MSAGERHFLPKWQLSGCNSNFFQSDLGGNSYLRCFSQRFDFHQLHQWSNTLYLSLAAINKINSRVKFHKKARLEGQVAGPKLGTRLTRQWLPLWWEGDGQKPLVYLGSDSQGPCFVFYKNQILLFSRNQSWSCSAYCGWISRNNSELVGPKLLIAPGWDGIWVSIAMRWPGLCIHPKAPAAVLGRGRGLPGAVAWPCHARGLVSELTSGPRWSTYLPTGLGRHFKGCFECSSLLRGKYCPWSFRSSWVLPIITSFSLGYLSFGGLNISIFIITFNWWKINRI